MKKLAHYKKELVQIKLAADLVYFQRYTNLEQVIMYLTGSGFAAAQQMMGFLDVLDRLAALGLL